MRVIEWILRSSAGTAVAALVIFLAVVGAAAVVRAEGPEAWTGTYRYTESGGRTAGGTGIVVSHEIAVRREGGAYRAEITANGYQTSRQIHAAVEIAGNRMRLSFERDGEDQMFKGQYQPGAVLLEIERQSPQRLLTYWRAYTPATTERYQNPGVYFKR